MFSVFVLLCVKGGKNLKLLTIYLNHLCSLIHGIYFMHLVTRFKGADPNTDTEADYVLWEVLVIILQKELGVCRSSGGSKGLTTELQLQGTVG